MSSYLGHLWMSRQKSLRVDENQWGTKNFTEGKWQGYWSRDVGRTGTWDREETEEGTENVEESGSRETEDGKGVEGHGND